jgi:RimJ/RimL family protein N-acetyltransferase/predicted RNA methylase
MNGSLTRWLDRILAKPIRYLFETPGRLLKGRVKQGMTVLDVGCGEGYYSLGMARSVGTQGRVIAVDTEAEAIAILRAKAKEAGLSERIDARVCGAEDLDIGDLDGRIDFALAVYVVHHARDVSSLMSNVHRALKPGGEFLVVEPRHHASTEERESAEDTARTAGFTIAGYPRLKRDWAASFVKKPVRDPVEIKLEELERRDFERIRPWIDPRTFRVFHSPVDDDQLSRLLTAHVDGKPTSLGYRIVRTSDGEVIGLVHAIIDWRNSLAHIGQIVVGDPALRGLGIGTDALNRFLSICFDDLGLHRAQLFVDDDNAGAIACYRKAGLQVEGLMREATRVGSGYVSWHSMSILEEEWRTAQRRR